MSDQRISELADQLKPLADRFSARGHSLFLVGGIVRDALVDGAELRSDYGSGDYDLTTDARPEAILEIVRPLASALWTQGERFGTIGATLDERPLEITTHRAEVYDPDSRKPVVSFGDDLETDLSRRDFTINSMAIDLSSGELIDPFGGEDDLRARRLRTPLDPEISFTDDPLRMLRACRFLPRFGLTPDPDLEGAATRLSGRLSIVSVERIHDEFERLLSVKDPSSGLDFARRTGILAAITTDLASDADLGRGIELQEDATEPLDRRVRMFAPLGRDGLARLLKRLRYSNDDRTASLKRLDLSESLAHLDPGRPGLRRLLDASSPSEVAAALHLAGDLGLVGPEALAEVGSELEAMVDDGDVGPFGVPLDGAALMELFDLNPGPEIGRLNRCQKELLYANGRMTREAMISALRQPPLDGADVRQG